jgi:hypothetical protein
LLRIILCVTFRGADVSFRDRKIKFIERLKDNSTAQVRDTKLTSLNNRLTVLIAPTGNYVLQ